MKQDMDELLDAADHQITHPNPNPDNLCQIFEEVLDLADYGKGYPEIQGLRNRLNSIAILMGDALLLGEMRYESRMEMAEALNRNNFWRCPKCGWVPVIVFRYMDVSGDCRDCGRQVEKVHGVWKELTK